MSFQLAWNINNVMLITMPALKSSCILHRINVLRKIAINLEKSLTKKNDWSIKFLSVFNKLILNNWKYLISSNLYYFQGFFFPNKF